MRPPIIAHTSHHLKTLVEEAMNEHGVAVDLNHIDVAQVRQFGQLFEDSPFNGNISQWDVSGALGMERMFANCSFNGDISEWNTSGVNDMHAMFQGSRFNGDISRWDVSSAKDMAFMFSRSAFNGDVSQWNTASAVIMSGMFEGSPFNGDVSKWNTSTVQSMRYMFAHSAFNGDLSMWDIQAASLGPSKMEGMFFNGAFSGDLSQWKFEERTPGMFGLLDETFKGTAPTSQDIPSVEFHRNLFKNDAVLKKYLMRTPFNGVHFDVCFTYLNKPIGVQQDDFDWVKEQEQLGKSLGLGIKDIRLHALEQYANRGKAMAFDTAMGDVFDDVAHRTDAMMG